MRSLVAAVAWVVAREGAAFSSSSRPPPQRRGSRGVKKSPLSSLRAVAEAPVSSSSSSSSAAKEEDATELSSSFEGAVADAASSVIRAVGGGFVKVRVDFDTTLGDATYTTLKSTMPFAKAVARTWALELAAQNKTLALWFPDAGSAALAKDQWKKAPLPPNCRLAAFPRDQPSPADDAFFVVCPRASEAEATERLVDGAAADLRPIVLLNPALVDMGTTGYGLAGRMLKNRLLNALEPAYYLKTLEWGAVARTYPRRFTVWAEDAAQADGYTFARAYDALPNGEQLEELYDELFPPDQAATGGVFGVIDGIGKFIENFQRM